MSSINVANINFDSSANNVLYVNAVSNNFVFKIGTGNHNINSVSVSVGNSVANIVSNNSGVYKNGNIIQNFTYGINEYVLMPSNAVTQQPTNTVLSGLNYDKTNYPNLSNTYHEYWPGLKKDTTTLFANVVFGNGVYVGVASGGDSISTSTDGINYTTTASNLPAGDGADGGQSCGYGNNLFVVSGQTEVNNRLLIYTSPDGYIWTSRTSASTTSAASSFGYGVAYGNGVYIIVGQDGGNVPEIQSSTDGITWTARTSANNNTLLAATYANGIFVVVGNVGSIQTSTDGTTWTNRTTANTNNMRSVTYGNGVYVAVGDNGSIQSSTNGITWTNRTSANSNNLYSVTYHEGVFITVGLKNTIQISNNGANWVNMNSYFGSVSDFRYALLNSNNLIINSIVYSPYNYFTQTQVPRISTSNTNLKEFVRYA